MKSKLAQVSTELIILLFVVMGLFLVLLTVSNSRETQLAGIKQYLSAKDVADTAAWSINTALVGGFGSRRSFFVPAKLVDGTEFNVTINASRRSVIVEWRNREYIAPLLTSDVIGNKTLAQGRVNVTNTIGVINVAQ